MLRSFLAYQGSFFGGIYVSAGDLDGDQKAKIIVGLGAGAESFVRVFYGASPDEIFQFPVANSKFHGGVRVGLVRDLNGNGRTEIITGTGPGGGSHVQVFDGLTHQILDDLIVDKANLSGGIFVAGRR